jgi:hypothetical protein
MSVDKLIVRCYSRLKHTYKVPSKPIPQGYKIYGIIDYGYLYAFL